MKDKAELEYETLGKLFINSNAAFGELWLEGGLVVLDGPLGKKWMVPDEVTAITPTSWSEHPAPLRVVE